jgi:hypothetical protein
VDEPNTMEHTESSPIIPSPPVVDDGYEAWVSEPVPQHATEAYETYLAELDELLSHLAAHPAERWVAYRNRQRLGFGTDDLTLYHECLAKFPDRRFCLYGIDACARSHDTVV